MTNDALRKAILKAFELEVQEIINEEVAAAQKRVEARIRERTCQIGATVARRISITPGHDAQSNTENYPPSA